MTICQIAVRGMNNTVIKKIQKKDYGIIDRLCKHQQIDGKYKNFENAFPDYVNKVFKSFAETQTSLAFSFDNCQKYIGIVKVFGFIDQRGLLKFDYLCQTFPNCQHIVVLECASNASKVKAFMVPFTKIFASKLLAICDKINAIKNKKIESIIYRHNVELAVSNNVKEYYEKQFGEKNWTLIFTKFDKVKPTSAINGKAYTLTLKYGYTSGMTNDDKMMVAQKMKRQNSNILHHFDSMSNYQRPRMDYDDLMSTVSPKSAGKKGVDLYIKSKNIFTMKSQINSNRRRLRKNEDDDDDDDDGLGVSGKINDAHLSSFME